MGVENKVVGIEAAKSSEYSCLYGDKGNAPTENSSENQNNFFISILNL